MPEVDTINPLKEEVCVNPLEGDFRTISPSWLSFVWIVTGLLLGGTSAIAQSQSPFLAGAESDFVASWEKSSSVSEKAAEQESLGSVAGIVVDHSGAFVAGAHVRITFDDRFPSQEAVSDGDGKFSFGGVPPGTFHLTINATGFATLVSDGVLHSGETQTIPQIELTVAANTTEVNVSVSLTEIAEDQLKAEEKQRVLGVFPNFYVTYIQNAAPLKPRQKFELAWKSLIDPVSFGVTGAIAGIQQANDDFSGYGQGAQGYAKRYGASYANFATGAIIGGAILPSLLKQDPRYFYKGTGTKRSRVLYALANSVICKGDNGHWQTNYSGMLGGLASGGISNLYYPKQDREGLQLTFENALIGIGATATVNIIQEFFIKKFTSNLPPNPSTLPN